MRAKSYEPNASVFLQPRTMSPNHAVKNKVTTTLDCCWRKNLTFHANVQHLYIYYKENYHT